MSRNGNIFNTWSATSPYNTLPALPPAGLELETKVVLKAAIAARAALAGLKEATKLIPNPAVLINTIPLLEAQASSEIENIVTTTDALFRAAHAEERTNDAATKEALRYRSALLEGFHSLKDRPLTTSTAVRVCSRLKGIEMEIRRISGTALVSDRTVIYTPPVGEDVAIRACRVAGGLHTGTHRHPLHATVLPHPERCQREDQLTANGFALFKTTRCQRRARGSH